MNLISEVYNIRTCKLTLNENDIQKGNYKECLEYHIKRCKAPCIGLQSKEEYGKEISEIREILKGRTIELNKNIVDILVDLNAASSKREAREFVSGNSIEIKGAKVTDINTIIDETYLTNNTYLIIKRGKKNYYIGKANM